MASVIYEKMINEAMAAQKADVGVIREKRGKKFEIGDAKPYVDAVNGMSVGPDQTAEVIDLHVESVNAQFEIFKSLTGTIRPEDDPFVEHYQTPPIFEILKEEDADFKKSVDAFIKALKDNEALLSKESVRRYGGFYGPACVVDFAFSPGSTTNVVNQILRGMNIPADHKKTILAAKSWGMLSSYGVGATFQQSLEAGNSAAKAQQDEVEMMQMVYDQPIAAQAKLMTDHGHTSFDVKKYMNEYKDRMRDTVLKAVKAGVHPGNVVVVPAYCVGDIAHHIAQSMFNMAKDDVTFGIIEAESEVLENTLRRGLDKFESPFDVLSVATGATAAGAAYILDLDAFTPAMVIDLLVKRYHNLVQKNPTRGPAAELHNVDFMDMIHRGFKINEPKPIGAGGEVKGVKVDLSPIDNHEVISNPQRYTYPACAITVRFSSMMRLADFPCLLTSEPVTATLMTNIIALMPDTAMAPARVCKDCASCIIDHRHHDCEWDKAI